ncbi:MAG: hypothetical protein ACHRXM_38860 [Isosphaerales bacterium]
MKFFTPDLIDRFGSADDGIAFAAQQEFEGRSEEYLRQLHEIEVKLPERFRELLDQFYLHDSRGISHSWQYDEVELIRTDRGKEFRHSILFTKGLELRLRFKDFDFATLKPIEIAPEFAEA